MEYVQHYDTSSSIGIIIFVCMPEALGTATYCEFSRLTRSYALTHARETRHSHDALIAGRRFLPRHINQYNDYNQLITYPTHTTHSHAPSRQYNCTMGNKTIYIMKIPQSQTQFI